MADDPRVLFELFTEFGIIAQLNATMLETALPPGVLASHFGVLSHLSRRPEGQTPLTLARAFQVPKTTMTHTLAGLTKRGLVEARPNPADGRSKLIAITDEGRRFFGEALARLGPDLGALAGRFTPDRAAAILPEVRALREILDAMRDEKEARGA